MMTYVTHADFYDVGWALDPGRLRESRDGALLIARALINSRRTGHGDPSVAMWSLHVGALLVYGRTLNRVWNVRNSSTVDALRFDADLVSLAADVGLLPGVSVRMPGWVGSEELHRSHRSRLLAEEDAGKVSPRGWYREQDWASELPHDLPLWHPNHHGFPYATEGYEVGLEVPA